MFTSHDTFESESPIDEVPLKTDLYHLLLLPLTFICWWNLTMVKWGQEYQNPSVFCCTISNKINEANLIHQDSSPYSANNATNILNCQPFHLYPLY